MGSMNGIDIRTLPSQGSTIGRHGLVRVMSNAQIEANAIAEGEAKAALPSEETMISLAGFLRSQWSDAQRVKQDIEVLMIESRRLVNGEYDPAKLAAIREIGSEIFMMIPASKCRDASAWIMDINRPSGDKNWSIEPTPRPDLPLDMENRIRQNVVTDVMSAAMMETMATGRPIDPNTIGDMMESHLDEVVDSTQQMLVEKATKICERMSTKIEDQLIEGKWHNTYKQFVSDVVKDLAGIIRTIVRKKKQIKWNQGPNGWEPTVVDEIIKEYYRVDPLDAYPGPDTKDFSDGYFIEKHRLSRTALNRLLGVPGYNDKEIRAVLNDYSKGFREWTAVDAERAAVENNVNGMHLSGNIEALEYWGDVQGKLLLEYGLSPAEVPDPDIDYQVNAWLIGSHVIKAVINPDPLGMKPYYKTSYEKVTGSFWGKGVPLIVKDITSLCNSTARALQNNMANASGPLVEVDDDRGGSAINKVEPWMVIHTTNQTMREGKAVNFYQVSMHVQELWQAYKDGKKEADEQSGIPAYSHGDTQVGGAGNTAGGLSMLMTAAARGIKQVLSNIDDDVTGPVIEDLYNFNMRFDPDETIKGDARVNVRGVQSLIAKEQLAVRVADLLDKSNNPVDIGIMGAYGRVQLWREALKPANIDPRKIFPRELLSDNRPAAPTAPPMMGAPVDEGGSAPVPPARDMVGATASGEDGKLMHGRP